MVRPISLRSRNLLHANLRPFRAPLSLLLPRLLHPSQFSHAIQKKKKKKEKEPKSLCYSFQLIFLILDKDWEYYLTIAALPFTLLLLALGWVSARFEHRYGLVSPSPPSPSLNPVPFPLKPIFFFFFERARSWSVYRSDSDILSTRPLGSGRRIIPYGRSRRR